ncbi:hypothetical protein N2597_19840 [Rhizobium sophoriradicis]|uniref:hypothetical protein n=1 Tax=Rhizobium sophoriradicis TaxID=1535245 RepID=UPI001620F726|nr:hypothetical protein N2597_19840 [Rhizobium leguminosarum bv. phaseoli]
MYEARADCETGDLWTEGKHYRFEGPETESKDFYGYISMKDTETGKRVGMSNADRGREFGAMWLKLCPFGWPYNDIPVQRTFATEDRYGEFMGHNGSLMFHHQKQHIIVYSQPKASIAGSIKAEDRRFPWLECSERVDFWRRIHIQEGLRSGAVPRQRIRQRLTATDIAGQGPSPRWMQCRRVQRQESQCKTCF